MRSPGGAGFNQQASNALKDKLGIGKEGSAPLTQPPPQPQSQPPMPSSGPKVSGPSHDWHGSIRKGRA